MSLQRPSQIHVFDVWLLVGGITLRGSGNFGRYGLDDVSGSLGAGLEGDTQSLVPAFLSLSRPVVNSYLPPQVTAAMVFCPSKMEPNNCRLNLLDVVSPKSSFLL